ncbi:MAG TPA: ion channel [Acidimicrobiales bacterium]|nr:ion channel [Acidimicrobiales bacterium]
MGGIGGTIRRGGGATGGGHERPMDEDLTPQTPAERPTDLPIIRRGVLREAARASDSYGLLLFLVLVDYILLSVGWTGDIANLVATAFICATALLGFHTSHVRGTALRVVRVACVVALGSAIVSALLAGDKSTGTVFLICALLILATPFAVLSRILRHREVTVETLLGAVSVYVLLGLVFGYADSAVQLIGGNSFFAQSGKHGTPDFVYFSFITMTTVGYGDLTPANGFPRTMAVTEALVGQVFLVILVARLVAMYQPRVGGRRALLRARRATVEEEYEDEPEAAEADNAEDETGPGG